MLTTQGWTQDTKQNQNLILPDGSALSLTLKYVPLQFGWFIDSLVYQSFTLTGYRLFTSPNLLQQYVNQIPFGLACLTSDNGEPTQQQDLSSGYATIYILTAAEAAQFTRILRGEA